MVEIPPGAKPKTKHIFVAPLISFYGCVPNCQRSAEPSRNIWSGLARLCVPIEGKSERHVKTTIRDDHNQSRPQSKMTTKKSQIFGQVEIGGNLTSAVNCEAGDSSFEAAPFPKLASHTESQVRMQNMKILSNTNRFISPQSERSELRRVIGYCCAMVVQYTSWSHFYFYDGVSAGIYRCQIVR